jgi:Lrp/AsnC family transcriptional regulator, leucine-responsive regulatory protein
MEKAKLDLKDKKILTLLDENARYTNSQISKKVGLSKPSVENRIQRLIKERAIFQFYTVIDFTKLGYSHYKLYFKFQNVDLIEEKRIIEYWNEEKNSVWVGQVRGEWDLSVSILAKNNYEFGRILSEFMNKFSQFILKKDVLLTEYSPMYAREYLAETKPSEFVYGIPSKIYELDEADRKILKELAKNARMNIIDLASKNKLTRDIINYRIKKLLKEKIIVAYRCYLNLENVGINSYKLMIRTKNFNEKNEKAVKDFVSSHKKITQMLKLIGSWDLEFEVETSGEEELYEILTEIRKKFSDIIRDFDILRIIKTIKYDYFPF